MIGATAKAEQFQSRSGSDATKGSRKGFSLLGGGESPLVHLTDEERRDSLVQVLKGLNARLVQEKAAGNRVEIKKLGVQISECGLAISAIRRKLTSERPNDIPAIFMDICREQMTKFHFGLLMDEANRRQRAALSLASNPAKAKQVSP